MAGEQIQFCWQGFGVRPGFRSGLGLGIRVRGLQGSGFRVAGHSLRFAQLSMCTVVMITILSWTIVRFMLNQDEDHDDYDDDDDDDHDAAADDDDDEDVGDEDEHEYDDDVDDDDDNVDEDEHEDEHDHDDDDDDDDDAGDTFL